MGNFSVMVLFSLIRLFGGESRVRRLFWSIQNTDLLINTIHHSVMCMAVSRSESKVTANNHHSYWGVGQWRIQGGFLVARKPLPPAMIFFLNQGGDTVTGTDPHQPLTFATFGNPHRDQLWIRHCWWTIKNASLNSH